ncbi:MAG TPA: PspC domain-containing protein [Anaerolineales bacterium]
MENKLYRSRTDVMVGGVCAGLGAYLGVSTTLVRLFFVLLAFSANGFGVLIYFLLWMIVPPEDEARDASLQRSVIRGSEEIAGRAQAIGYDLREIVRRPNPQAGLIIGSGLILVGVLYLLENLRLPWLSWLNIHLLWPVLLIVGGLALLLRRPRGG